MRWPTWLGFDLMDIFLVLDHNDQTLDFAKTADSFTQGSIELRNILYSIPTMYYNLIFPRDIDDDFVWLVFFISTLSVCISNTKGKQHKIITRFLAETIARQIRRKLKYFIND